MKKLLFVLMLCFSTIVSAQSTAESTATLSWEAPTTRVDGTPFSKEELSAYRIYYSVDTTVTMASDFVTAESFQLRDVITLQLAPRAEPYIVYFAMTAVDTDGRESTLSETVSKEYNVSSTADPNPPTSVTFTISCGDGCKIEEVVATPTTTTTTTP